MTGTGGRFSMETDVPCETPPTTKAKQNDYCYDRNGNMVLNGDSMQIEWTPYGKVKTVRPLVTTTTELTENRSLRMVEQITTDTLIQADTLIATQAMIGNYEVILQAADNITFRPGFSFSPNQTGHLMARIGTSPPEQLTEETPPIYTTFGYDAAQNRILKSVEKEGIITNTYYIRDAQGNMMATYETKENILTWKEKHLYGSNRLGILETNINLDSTTKSPYFVDQAEILSGKKRYELSNHLRNVLTVMSDLKSTYSNSTFEGTRIRGQVLSATDYYPFGLDMPSRDYKNTAFGESSYRFGFNGKELDKDGEWGSATHYDYGFRIYDPSIGKFLSVDPLTASYPMLTPYQFAHNSPIAAIDLDGLEAEGTNEEINKTFRGDDLPEVNVTAKAKGSNSDQQTDRYGFNGNWEQYQKEYGLEGWSQENYSNYYNQVLSPDHDSYVENQDRIERERITLKKLTFFKDGFIALSTTLSVGGGGGPINGVNFKGASLRGMNLAKARARIAQKKVDADETVTYYRAQGKTNRSQISIDELGNITFNSKSSLHVSRGSGLHARYFALTKGVDRNIISFKVPKWFDDFIMANAISSTKYRTNALNQGRTAPKIVDSSVLRRLGIDKNTTAFEFPGKPTYNWSQLFQESVIQGSGKVIKP